VISPGLENSMKGYVQEVLKSPDPVRVMERCNDGQVCPRQAWRGRERGETMHNVRTNCLLENTPDAKPPSPVMGVSERSKTPDCRGRIRDAVDARPSIPLESGAPIPERRDDGDLQVMRYEPVDHSFRETLNSRVSTGSRHRKRRGRNGNVHFGLPG